MSDKLTSYILFPDTLIVGQSNIVSVRPDAGGEFVGPMTSEVDNSGSMLTNMQGSYKSPTGITLTKDQKHFDCRLQAGGRQDRSTYVHRPGNVSDRLTIEAPKAGGAISLYGEVVINTIPIDPTFGLDAITNPANLPEMSSLAKSRAINKTRELHQVTADPLPIVIEFQQPITGGTINPGQLILNGVGIPGPTPFLPNDSTSSLRNTINSLTVVHGLEASLSPFTGYLVLTGVSRGYESGANVQIFIDPAISASIGWTGASSSVQLSGMTLSSNTHIDFTGSSNPSVIGVSEEYISNQDWYGWNDERYIHDQHGGMNNRTGDGACAVFLKRYNREMLYSMQGTSPTGEVTVNVSYKNVDDRPDQWTNTTIQFKSNDFFGVGFTYAFVKMCSAIDGTLRMVTRDKQGDFNIWRSEDGLSWSIISPSVGKNYLDTLPQFPFSPNLDSSGPYLRLAWMDVDPATSLRIIRTIVSPDGGLSWLEPETNQPLLGIDENQDLIDQWIFCIGGMKDDSGTFIMTYLGGGFIRAMICSGITGWVDLDGFTNPPFVPSMEIKSHISCCRGIDKFFIYFQYKTTQSAPYSLWHRDGAEAVVFIVDPENIGSVTNWPMYPFYGSWQGAMKWVPANINMYNTGKYLGFFSSVVDIDVTPSGFYEADKTMYWQFFGWSKQPIADSIFYQPTNRLSTEEDYLLSLAWSSPTGQPAPVGNANVANGTPWVRSRLGATSNYSSSRVRLTDGATPLGDFYYFEFDDSANVISNGAPTWCATSSSVGAESVVEVDVKIEQGPDNATSTPNVYFRVVSGKGTAPFEQVDVSVHIGKNNIVAYDNIASSLLTNTEIFINTTDWVRVRLAIKAENIGTFLSPFYVPQVFLSAKPIGRYGDPITSNWSHGIPQSLSETTVGAFEQKLEFGMAANPVGLVTRVTHWRSAKVMVGSPTSGANSSNALGQFKNIDTLMNWPRDLRGHLVTANPVQMGYGVSAIWSGAAGSYRDHMNGDPTYQYDPSNKLLPSPRIQYRSIIDENRTSTETYQCVLVADPDDPILKFRFNAIASFEDNIGDVTIDISNDNVSWESIALDYKTHASHIASPDSVSAEGSNVIRINLAGGAAFIPFNGKFNTSDGHGYYVVLISGSTTRSFKILSTDNITETTYDLTLDTTIDLRSQLWSEAKIYTGRWVWRDINDTITEARYIRITGSNQLSWSSNQYLYVGTLMIGVTKTLEVPFEWTMSDNEQPNITNYKTKGGLSWSYVEGPPQRSISGRFVGDVTARMRESIRQLLRSKTEYENKPVVLVMDDTIDPPASPPFFTEGFETTSVGSLPVGFSTSGDANWAVSTLDAHTGTKSAISEDIGDGEESIMQYSATLTSPSLLTFWWKCSSEDGFDFLELRLNGIVAGTISGLTDWIQFSAVLGAGPITITWRYFKDGSVTVGDDHGRVDDISLSEITTITEPRYVDPNNVILARITSGTKMSNAAWYKEGKENLGSTQEDWQVAGDLQIQFEEEV